MTLSGGSQIEKVLSVSVRAKNISDQTACLISSFVEKWSQAFQCRSCLVTQAFESLINTAVYYKDINLAWNARGPFGCLHKVISSFELKPWAITDHRTVFQMKIFVTKVTTVIWPVQGCYVAYTCPLEQGLAIHFPKGPHEIVGLLWRAGPIDWTQFCSK